MRWKKKEDRDRRQKGSRQEDGEIIKSSNKSLFESAFVSIVKEFSVFLREKT